MDTGPHSLHDLFGQLGLPNEVRDITRFVAAHRPIPSETKLHEAHFWSKAQRDFLQQAIERDADWAVQVDQLDALLR